MLKIQKQISIILLLVFTFPIIYQQVHVLYHHTVSHKHTGCNHHHCSHDKVEPINLLVSSYSKKNKDNTCVICDYKFTANQMPVDFQYSDAVDYTSELKIKFKETNFVYSYILAKSSRAPPVSSLLS